VFWVMVRSAIVGGYQCFGRTFCIHLNINAWHRNPEDHSPSVYCHENFYVSENCCLLS
jgi:hypothetical protein